ncbi:MAG TPA: TlpA disulfide reductase family protein [Mycobacterium sp.]|uniref:TlpA family protein disulfide reductase n=1 Tax=Mycolicibacterium sp. TaxID=2320850 RepID=UPI0025EAFF9D|nr:TlpA disulfide reductase family protein [Mycolicibacterium sp.]HPX37005.1 TlpA disulfide reductase family protein [Mycobacterium sp.]HQC78186.1 TlpA disulfide reductase family protein [Mycobacterium sp.]
MTVSTRWTLTMLAVVVAVIVALALQLRDHPESPAARQAPAARTHRDADTAAALAGPRQRADLPPCPADGPGAGPAALRGIVVECAADGTPVDVARALAGRTVVLNLWAYWCGPCAEELPALARYQQQAGDAVTVVTVHQDENETAALIRMADLGVRLPVLQDGRRSIAAALGVPNVMPATVVLRPDGSVAKMIPTPFTSADEISAAVSAALA